MNNSKVIKGVISGVIMAAGALGGATILKPLADVVNEVIGPEEKKQENNKINE